METGPRKDLEKTRSARIRRSQFASRRETNVISAGVATKSAARLSESALVDVNHCRAEQVHRTQGAFGPVNRQLFTRELELQGSLGLGASSIFGGALLLRHCSCFWFCFGVICTENCEVSTFCAVQAHGTGENIDIF